MEKRNYIHNTELHEYEVGVIILDVPVEYFKKDYDAMEYRRKNIEKKWWKDRIEKLEKEFDINKFKPIYYCKKCKRMEDGARRLHYAEKHNMKTIAVKIGDDCYKRYKKKELIIEAIPEPEKYLHETRETDIFELILSKMKEFPTSHRLDKKWLHALANDKWKYIEPIDFKDKSYLDIGCHVGYSCFRAWQKGATDILGIDIREDVLTIAMEVRKELRIDKMYFLQNDWNRFYNSPEGDKKFEFDIVSMLGLIHYFPKKIYKKVLKSLCDTAKKTLILELRIIHSNHSFVQTIQKQTLPSTKWLVNALKQYGFKHFKRHVRESRRELWIAKR